MPQWLKTVLLAAGLIIGLAFLAEPVLNQKRPPRTRPRVVLANYGRLVVTYSQTDDTVYALRPPGEDPRKVLRAARLILPEGSYGELADQLGVPPSWPVE